MFIATLLICKYCCYINHGGLRMRVYRGACTRTVPGSALLHYINYLLCNGLQWMPFEEYAAQPFVQKYEFLRYLHDICKTKIDGNYTGFSPIPTTTYSVQKSYLYLNSAQAPNRQSKLWLSVLHSRRILARLYIWLYPIPTTSYFVQIEELLN